MTPTHIISPLALAVDQAVRDHTHFYAFEGVGIGTRCVICSTAWETAELWAADSGICPGYVQPCGQPAMLPSQPVSIGPVAP